MKSLKKQGSRIKGSASERRVRILLRTAVLLLAAFMIFCGFSNGEMQLIYRKAVTICLECIGIG
ncbi:MAG: CD1871A family CXXC motif-containing protein [Eubacteriales bacterium]|nr:CD1871A family CXXC motif-containing protein [Eubacteriales bacterium]